MAARDPHRGALDIDGILGALVEAEVRFVLVGGLAVAGHGYGRATDDIDICPEPTSANFERLETALRNLGAEIAGMEEFDPEELPQPDADGLALGGNFVLATRLGGLDIMQMISPDLTYEQLGADSIEVTVHGLPVRICSYENLVAMKEAAGREQDIADLANLRAIRADD